MLRFQMDRRLDISDTKTEMEVQFSYAVTWYAEPMEWKDRHTNYAENKFLPSSFEIHWLSIINSFVLVLLLTAFLTIILLRILKNDFSRYMELEDEAFEEEEVWIVMFLLLVRVILHNLTSSLCLLSLDGN